MKTAFICFFPVFPTNMGSAEVIRSLFLCWPGKKKVFQISHINNKKNSNLYSLKIFKENSILKLLVIPILVYRVLKYLYSSKKKIIIIEGPSWIGYSFFSLILIRIFSPNTKIIYHSHSIEYEVRKMTSSKFITYMSKLFENYVFNKSDISTSVSKIEMNKIQKLYNTNCIKLNNGISEKVLKFKKKKKFNFQYLIYCGSYKYPPNKYAIDYLISILMPKLKKKFPKLKLILTGGGLNKNSSQIINVGIVSKPKLLNLIFNSNLMVLPINKGTGTRIKIIEAMIVGAKILTTRKGIEGIEYKKSGFPIVQNKKYFFKSIIKILQNKKNKFKISPDFKDKYIMENIVKNFFKEKNVKKIFETN